MKKKDGRYCSQSLEKGEGQICVFMDPHLAFIAPAPHNFLRVDIRVGLNYTNAKHKLFKFSFLCSLHSVL